MDELFVNLGISDKQPLHVLMVDPKIVKQIITFCTRSHFNSTFHCCCWFGVVKNSIFICLRRRRGLMDATTLQKYIDILGGIETSGVGSSSSYSPKDLNNEIMPEKELHVKTFKDVKGIDDAKQELDEVVDYLKNPSKFTRLGGKLPKGILLTGSLGTGKTLLSKVCGSWSSKSEIFVSSGQEEGALLS